MLVRLAIQTSGARGRAGCEDFALLSGLVGIFVPGERVRSLRLPRDTVLGSAAPRRWGARIALLFALSLNFLTIAQCPTSPARPSGTRSRRDLPASASPLGALLAHTPTGNGGKGKEGAEFKSTSFTGVYCLFIPAATHPFPLCAVSTRRRSLVRAQYRP
jgi:hypothetical protein